MQNNLKRAHRENHAHAYACVRRLAARYDVSVATIWRWSAPQGKKLPKPKQLSPGCTRWDMEAVLAAEAEW